MMIRSLHVDIEGGWGGSSRSLFELISRLDRTRVLPHVVLRQIGPAIEWYAKIGVPTYHVPEVVSYVPRKNKPLKNFIVTVPRLRRLRAAATKIVQLTRQQNVDVLHLNYEGLFLIARQIRRQSEIPMIVHSRAYLPLNWWGRWVVRSLAATCNYALFISPQEKRRWFELAGKSTLPSEVIWNIARQPLARNSFQYPPEAIYLGSIDYSKGVDRLLDVARELDVCSAPSFIIALYGSPRTNPSFEAHLRNRIRDEKLQHRVEFRGHISDVPAVLARAFALIRPSRENDPWGRDVIEATTAGVPVLATGSFEGVIQSGINGYLFDPFDARAMARCLIQLHQRPALWRQLSIAAQRIGASRFSGESQAARFTEILSGLVVPAASRH